MVACNKYSFNKRVWATRPAAQNRIWKQLLLSRGCQVLEIPLLEIVKVNDRRDQQRIKDKIINLDQYQGVIFVSQNAAALAFEWIDELWPQIPTQLNFYAIGKRTASVIEEHLSSRGEAANLIALADNKSAMDSEAFLHLLSDREIRGEKYLIGRGKGGRPLLAQELEKRGAKVDYCELYERVLPATANKQMEAIQLDPCNDIITLFSGETLQNLLSVFNRNKMENWQTIPVVVPGARVVSIAQAAGFNHIISATNATDEAMWSALEQYLTADQYDQ